VVCHRLWEKRKAERCGDPRRGASGGTGNVVRAWPDIKDGTGCGRLRRQAGSRSGCCASGRPASDSPRAGLRQQGDWWDRAKHQELMPRPSQRSWEWHSHSRRRTGVGGRGWSWRTIAGETRSGTEQRGGWSGSQLSVLPHSSGPVWQSRGRKRCAMAGVPGRSPSTGLGEPGEPRRRDDPEKKGGREFLGGSARAQPPMSGQGQRLRWPLLHSRGARGINGAGRRSLCGKAKSPQPDHSRRAGPTGLPRRAAGYPRWMGPPRGAAEGSDPTGDLWDY